MQQRALVQTNDSSLVSVVLLARDRGALQNRPAETNTSEYLEVRWCSWLSLGGGATLTFNCQFANLSIRFGSSPWATTLLVDGEPSARIRRAGPHARPMKATTTSSYGSCPLLTARWTRGAEGSSHSTWPARTGTSSGSPPS